MKAFNNFFLHAAVLAACAVVMIVNVVVTGANSFEELSIYGKIAGIVFTADLVAYVAYTMAIALKK